MSKLIIAHSDKSRIIYSGGKLSNPKFTLQIKKKFIFWTWWKNVGLVKNTPIDRLLILAKRKKMRVNDYIVKIIRIREKSRNSTEVSAGES